MECGSYRGNKLLEHAMKVVERIFVHAHLFDIDSLVGHRILLTMIGNDL